MNHLLKNFLFALVAVATLSIVACTDDTELPVEISDDEKIAEVTGIIPSDTDAFELTVGTKNGQDVIVLSGEINRDIIIEPLTAYEWLFSGAVFVAQCAELTIEEGTTIYFDVESAQTSFLSVAQCAKVNANGAANNRILMTSSNDGLGSGTGAASGDWGGFVVNGYGNINVGETADGEGGTGTYGGSDDTDNSGSIRYVVLKYPGKIVGVDNELNGFSFNGVGSGTTIEYIQTYQGADDGIEFFGGAANVKYAVVIGAKDDSFDWTHGWRGKGQYWLAIQTANRGDRCIEADNLEADFAAAPYSAPTLANLTLIASEGNDGDNSYGMRLRHGTKGKIHNAAVTGATAYGIRADDDATTGANVADGSLVVTNSTVFGIDANATAWGKDAAGWDGQTGNVSTIVSLTDGIGTITGGADANAVYADAFFTADTNIGAVDAANNWLSGWAIKTDGTDY
ncbi:MAG: hypothetical protein ACJAUH_000519 [Saprospiraceae bacterium]|jgi:hypothetical protein